MRRCFASSLGDCHGPLELEHFVPKVLQRMMGAVDVQGLAWQKGATSHLQPTTYASGRVLCRRHHDLLDGLDGQAAAFFRNIMLIANPNHIATGEPGELGDITPVLDGRALERWFLKFICGAVATGSIRELSAIPERWVRCLFERADWPSEWALYVEVRSPKTVSTGDAGVHFDFHWDVSGNLNGLAVEAFAFRTLFSIQPPDAVEGFMERPRLLGSVVERPGRGAPLIGMSSGEPIVFEITWPGKPRVDFASLPQSPEEWPAY